MSFPLLLFVSLIAGLVTVARACGTVLAPRRVDAAGSDCRGERRRGPSEEERTAMKRFDCVAAGVVFALAAALGPRGADARDVTKIELTNAQGQPIGHATIAPESGR